jgi:hypothetical protein
LPASNRLTHSHVDGGKRGMSPSIRKIDFILCALTVAVIIYMWLEEVLDLPHMVGFQRTPVNWVESLMETVVVSGLGIGVIFLCNRLLRRIRYLEGFHAICANCKRIRLDGNWVMVEEYMQRFSSMQLSHSICPECAKQVYNYEDGEESDQEAQHE